MAACNSSPSPSCFCATIHRTESVCWFAPDVCSPEFIGLICSPDLFGNWVRLDANSAVSDHRFVQANLMTR